MQVRRAGGIETRTSTRVRTQAQPHRRHQNRLQAARSPAAAARVAPRAPAPAAGADPPVGQFAPLANGNAAASEARGAPRGARMQSTTTHRCGNNLSSAAPTPPPPPPRPALASSYRTSVGRASSILRSHQKSTPTEVRDGTARSIIFFFLGFLNPHRSVRASPGISLNESHRSLQRSRSRCMLRTSCFVSQCCNCATVL